MKNTTKTLTIEIVGTERKRHEIERAIRSLLNDWEMRRGVHSMKIYETNTASTAISPTYGRGTQ